MQTKPQEISITVDGATYKTVTGRILKSEKMQHYNSFENPNKIVPVTYNETKLVGNTLTIKLPATSVVVLELK